MATPMDNLSLPCALHHAVHLAVVHYLQIQAIMADVDSKSQSSRSPCGHAARWRKALDGTASNVPS